jgi:hypothetical protein
MQRYPLSNANALCPRPDSDEETKDAADAVVNEPGHNKM